VFGGVQGQHLPIPRHLEPAVVPLHNIRQRVEQGPHVVPLQIMSGRMPEDRIVCVLVAPIQIGQGFESVLSRHGVSLENFFGKSPNPLADRRPGSASGEFPCAVWPRAGR
jgi:hypothetical protein